MGSISKSEEFHCEHNYDEILTPNQIEALQEEFSRLKDSTYLDHGGATLYSKSQLESAMAELQGNLFSNPHSRNPSSSITTDATDHVRQRILQHFGTTENEYSVIFTSSATGALKLLAESFSFNDEGLFAYLEENHTSVIGMREYLLKNNLKCNHSGNHDEGQVRCISKSAMEILMNSTRDESVTCIFNSDSTPSNSDIMNGDVEIPGKNALFAFPAQCNFSGYKNPLEWIPEIQKGQLDKITEINAFYIQDSNAKDAHEYSTKIQSEPRYRFKWYVALDAASYVASNKLDLSSNQPDFVAISFYKMFGWPTGLGALIVRNTSAQVLGNKRYFGGGTVNISLPSEPFHVKRSKLHERFEDGTMSFLSILGVRHGLDALAKFFPSPNSMDLIRSRTFRLTQYLFKNLRRMNYANGQQVTRIYSDTEFDSEKTQGPVVTFNLLRPKGEIVGYSEMEQIAYLHNVSLRYGCFCNPGACRRHLGLSPEQVLKHYEAGHVCGDMRDIIDGHPTGAIRVSIGYMTTKENIDFLLRLIFNCWIKPFNINHEHTVATQIIVNRSNGSKESPHTPRNRLSKIFVYPIKSCAPFEPKTTWTIGPHGLLYDREWLIVNSNGVPLTTKREPRLWLIEPSIDISNRWLNLHFNGDDEDMQIPLDLNPFSRDYSIEAPLCNSKVCGDSIVGYDCGENAAKWLCRVLDKVDLRLIRMSPQHHRKPRNSLDEISLANQSQFLLLTMASLRHLAKELISNRLVSSLHIPQFNSECIFYSNQDESPQGHITLVEDTVVDCLIGRFRCNLVIDGPEVDSAYEEETWKGIRIGAAHFESGGPCMRCATICMDPLTGAKSSEPLLTLSRTRGGRPNFGIHLYSRRSTHCNLNYSRDNKRHSFLQTLRVGDDCQVVDNLEGALGNSNDTSHNIFTQVLETIQNID